MAEQVVERALGLVLVLALLVLLALGVLGLLEPVPVRALALLDQAREPLALLVVALAGLGAVLTLRGTPSCRRNCKPIS
jgi:hypothetical protein